MNALTTDPTHAESTRFAYRPTRRSLIRLLVAVMVLGGLLTGAVRPAGAIAPEVFVTNWFSEPVCAGGICTGTSLDDLPRVGATGIGFTARGWVFVGVFAPGASDATWHEWVRADGTGKYEVRTPYVDCSRFGGDIAYEVQAYDWSTDVWSTIAPFSTCRGIH